MGACIRIKRGLSYARAQFKSEVERRDWHAKFPQQFVYSGQKAQAGRGSEGEDEEEDGDNEERAQAPTEALAETVGSHKDAADEKSAVKLKRDRKASEGWDTLHIGTALLVFVDGPETKTQYAVFHIRHLFDEDHTQISMRAVCLDPSNPTVLCAGIRAKDVLRTFVWELYRKECFRQTSTEAERLQGLSSFMELYNKAKK